MDSGEKWQNSKVWGIISLYFLRLPSQKQHYSNIPDMKMFGMTS